MSILDSQLAPYIIILAFLAVLMGFFRKTLIRVIVFLAGELLLLVLYPGLLDHLKAFVLMIRNSLS
jgi:hypothetical protein